MTERRNEVHHERFGEKYLRIAYHQVYAQLADNYYLFGDYREKEAVFFDGSWQTELRTIDPSLVPQGRLNNAAQQSRPSNWWEAPAYELRRLGDENSTWLKKKDDLPDIQHILIRKDPRGTEWVALECYPRWDKQAKQKNATENKSRRSLWMQLRGYLVKKSTSGKVFQWMKRKDFMGRWMPEGSDFSNLFLGEYYNSPAWRHLATLKESPYKEWRASEGGCPGVLACVQEAYSQNSEDSSSIEPCRAMMPQPLLVREAGLRWTGNGAMWMDNNGEVVVQDPTIWSGGSGALLIRRDFLDGFLESRGYRLLWTILGEKLIYDWDDRFPRLSISGCAMYNKITPQVQIQARYKSP